jgi:hypothetical protein
MGWRRSTPSVSSLPERALDVARRAGAAYAATGKVGAVLVAGSVARGSADRYSDLELDVYWIQTPTDADRWSVIDALGGTAPIVWPYSADEGEWADNYRVDGVDVGVSGFLETWTTALIAKVMAGDPALDKQLRLAAIADGIVLSGAGIVQRWRARIEQYPDRLAVAVATSYLEVDRLGRWHQRAALVARDDVVPLRSCIPPVIEMVLGALCAVNSVLIIDPMFKWTDRLVASFTLAPPRLGERLRAIADGRARDAVALVDELLEETMVIVASRLPQVPLAALREELAMGRGAAAGF